MSERTVSFHRFEDSTPKKGVRGLAVICSFETRRFGYVQTELVVYDDMTKFSTLVNEPDLNLFSDSERLYMEKISTIVYKIVFDARAPIDRFK